MDLAVFAAICGDADAGVTILESLTSIAKQTENRKIRDTIIDLTWHIKRGYTLAKLVETITINFRKFLYMIEAGELSGNLSDVLKHLSIIILILQDIMKNQKYHDILAYWVTSLFVVNF